MNEKPLHSPFDITLLSLGIGSVLLLGLYIAWSNLTEESKAIVDVSQETYMSPRETIIIHYIPATLMPSEYRTVTGYTSRVQETDGSPCISADGSNICELLERGENTCASNNYRFGTVLHVEGLGFCTVRDRMAKKNTGKVDWYFGMDLQSARQWGVRIKQIVIVR